MRTMSLKTVYEWNEKFKNGSMKEGVSSFTTIGAGDIIEWV